MEIKELRRQWESSLDLKLFVVLESLNLIPEIYVLLSGENSYPVHHYYHEKDDWKINVKVFSNMKSALDYISMEFSINYNKFLI